MTRVFNKICANINCNNKCLTFYKKILPITTKTGRLIVSERVKECLGKEAVGTITPHSFRHYFVTNVLKKTGNMKVAQEFARHSSVTVTQRYTHLSNEELDQKYKKIFNE